MTSPNFAHGSFTIERQWKAAPSRVFSAWADPALKAQWFIGVPLAETPPLQGEEEARLCWLACCLTFLTFQSGTAHRGGE